MKTNLALVSRTWAVPEPASRPARAFVVPASSTGRVARWRLDPDGRLLGMSDSGEADRPRVARLASGWRRLVAALALVRPLRAPTHTAA